MSGFDFEQLYYLAIQNAPKKRKSDTNWVHVSRLGPGSTMARQICEYFGVDPEGTVFRKVEKMEV
ncbi:hypothetical protein IIQ44_16390 [Acinetobacter oleivorans]|uniref:hypothetical protein n=1 Tax=Acinetobacter oleivorans TaxID=1148157 RepID=UPI00178CE267|nr:hypothetical protein [Acinetobacter oleivorans]MBE2173474.1 hypothetical protein [Acinetobacter oleivorans]